MPSVTRRFTFEAAHRLLGHMGKCRHLHGHSYKVDVTVNGPHVGADGMLIDFGLLKDSIGKWIDQNLDHNIILHPRDPLVTMWKEMGGWMSDGQEKGFEEATFQGKNPFLMPPSMENPTAENIALLIFTSTGWMMPEGVFVYRVIVHETENCSAAYPS